MSRFSSFLTTMLFAGIFCVAGCGTPHRTPRQQPGMGNPTSPTTDNGTVGNTDSDVTGGDTGDTTGVTDTGVTDTDDGVSNTPPPATVCDSNTDCQAAGLTDLICCRGLGTDCTVGFCAPPPSAPACDSNTACGDEATCVGYDTDLTQKICTPRCDTEHPCQVNLVCVASFCEQPQPESFVCGADVECQTGLLCCREGVDCLVIDRCYAPLPAPTCTYDNDCPSDQSCQDGNCLADPDDGNDNNCAAGEVLICHIPPGNPAKAHVICVGTKATQAHLAHGDKLGACPTGD